MNILYSFSVPLGGPGIGTTAFHQIEGASEHGCAVTAIVTSVSRPITGSATVRTTLTIGQRRIPHRAVGVERAHRYHDRRVAAALARLGRGIDLVHCWPGAVLRTAAVAKRLGIPVVREAPASHTASVFAVTARESESLGIPPPRNHAHAFDRAHLDRDVAEFAAADYIFIGSDSARQTYIDHGIPSRKLLVHGYGFSPSAFPAPPSPAPRTDRLTFTYLGRLEPLKGVHVALRAWRESGLGRMHRLVIAGTFVDGYRDGIADLLNQPGVELRPFADDPGDLLRASDVLVLPTFSEGSALVTYEAQACGCALLVSSLSGAMCEHLRQGLIHEAGDVNQLAGQLRSLADDRHLLAKLQAGALAHRDELTWSRAGRRLARLYEDVVSGDQR